MKVDPRAIHVDQRKQDTRRDAWDRDYMGSLYTKTQPTTSKQVSNAAPVLVFAFFFVCLLVLIDSIA